MSQTIFGGWVDDKQAVAAVVRTLTVPYVSDLPFNFGTFGRPKTMYSWKFVEKALGRRLDNWNQGQVGRCVGYGYAKCATVAQAADIVLRGQAEKAIEYSPDAIYIGSRTVTGQKINGDGSVGAWAIKFATQYGFLPKGTYGGLDFDDAMDERLCRRLASSRMPDEVLKLCVHKTIEGSLVRTWDEAKNIIAKGGAIAICSDLGLTDTRDSNGMCRPQGQWMHCMGIIGYHEESGLDMGFVDNSWGSNFYKGDMGPGDGPRSGCYVDGNVIESRVLSSGDCFAIYDPAGIAVPIDYSFIF